MKTTRKIIVIMTDTQRWDMVGCYGDPAMHTPNLDHLAAQGMRFDRAYTTQPVCGPARSALFTGLYPHSTGSWANCMPLGDNVKTIGHRLSDQGFHTAYVGKWHLDGGDYFGLGRCPDGWDPAYWYDMRNYLDELTDDERLASREVRTMQKTEIRPEMTFGHRCSNRAIDFLHRHGDEDFLLVVSYDEPHDPFLSPQKYADLHRTHDLPRSPNLQDTLEEKPEHQRVWAGSSLTADRTNVERSFPVFLGCNSYVDQEIGRVVNAINQYASDALVLYTSDHGDLLHAHALNGKGPVAYEEITRIPMIARWPGVIPAGSVCPHPVSHINVVPTLLESAGLPVPKILEGPSLRTTLANPEERVNPRIYLEFNRYETDHDGFGGFQPLRTTFDGRYKLTVNLLVTDELYDLETDPDEMVNLIHSPDHTEIRNALHDSLIDWMNTTRDPFRGYYWERRPWRVDAKPATWAHTGMTRQRENEEYEPRQLDYATGLPIQEAVRKK